MRAGDKPNNVLHLCVRRIPAAKHAHHVSVDHAHSFELDWQLPACKHVGLVNWLLN